MKEELLLRPKMGKGEGEKKEMRKKEGGRKGEGGK